MNKKLLQQMISFGLVTLLLIGCASQATSQQITNKNTSDLVELKTIQGPTDGIASIALSPDGSILAYGNYTDNLIRLVKISSSEEIMTLEGHTDAVTSLVFSPNGQILASTSSDDGTVRIWDIATGKQLATFETSRTNQLAFTPDGKILAGAGGGDPVQVRLWDVENLSEKESMKNVFVNISFSSDGNLLATGSRDELVHVLEVASGKEVMSLAGHIGWVSATAFSPIGNLLASGSDDKTIQLWDANTGEKLKSLTGHESQVDYLAFSPDGSVLASLGSGVNINREGNQVSFSISSADEIVRFWDIETGRQIGLIKVAEGVSNVSFNSDWTLIATGNSKGVIQIWGVKP